MKIGKRAEAKIKATNPDKKNSQRSMMLIAVVAVTAVLIIWVFMMGRKAEDTVSVVMWAEPIYKNEVITESMLEEYKMLKGEFEKYAVKKSDGTKKRRIFLWDERDKLINTFAAYPLQRDTVALTSDIATSRTDNSDSVLYSFPGKNIVTLDVGEEELEAFKTFLEPGDRVNITAIFKVDGEVAQDDGFGKVEKTTVELYKEETVFKDVMIADLLNSSGDSILDLYASYNAMSVYEQAARDASDSWKEQTKPDKLLLALTPEEESSYYQYLSKKDVTFKMSLPQRSE